METHYEAGTVKSTTFLVNIFRVLKSYRRSRWLNVTQLDRQKSDCYIT